MNFYAIEILIIVFVIYGLAYVYYGKKLLQEKIIKADSSRPTPAYTRFDGVDYVPANKYVLYGHHFASIAGAGPIIGPAIAMSYGWALPLLWVLFGNVFIGAVHDYLSLMSSVRYGGISIMSVSENVMGKSARYISLAYVYFALLLVFAAFVSVASILFAKIPSAATVALIFMPLALLFGFIVYRAGVNLKLGTVIAVIIIILGFIYAYKIPFLLGYNPSNSVGNLWSAYHNWIIILSIYAILAASLPVWYLLQPRDYLNAYVLWFFVFFAAFGSLVLADYRLIGTAYTSFAPRMSSFAGQPTYFWPAIPLIIACGALSGFHSLVGSGTSSKQLSNELDALLVGYGGMLTEGAVSSMAVILPVSLAWSAPELYKLGVLKAGENMLSLSPLDRFLVGYGYMSGEVIHRLGGSFATGYHVFKLFAAIALASFVLTTLDTATRLARFAWQEMFDWLSTKSPPLHKFLTNRWFASFLVVLIGGAMAYPVVKLGGSLQPAYKILWPAFAGVNQLLAALALLTAALWVYMVLKTRGSTNWLIQVPAWFLWITVTAGLIWWTSDVMPKLKVSVQKVGAGSIVIVSLILDFLLIYYFVRGLIKASKSK